MSVQQINEIHATILRKLLQDGRKSIAEIAKETGLAAQVVRKSYFELKQAGIINGATIHINYKSFGCQAVASMQIRLNPLQADRFVDQMSRNPEIYSVNGNGPRGNVGVVTAFKTLQQLDEIKDAVRRNFLVSEIKTSIWTDVKEMHGNLTIVPETKAIGKMENMSGSTTEKQPISSNMKAQIDKIDEKIAEKLSENGRVPLKKIAKEIGISADSAKKRYEKLVKNGILKVTIQINPTRIGYQAAAVFSAITSHENPSSTIEKITRIPDTISIMKTTGDYDLQIWVLIKDVDQLLKTQDELRRIKEITKIDMEIMRMPSKWPTPRQYISTF